MVKVPSDSEAVETQPVDPDREWTGWALGTLRELVDIGMRTARRIETQQMATPIVPPPPDFALMQARVARAVRLSIAMTERIREAYRARKAEAETAAVELRERRQRRRAQVARAVVVAVRGEASADAGLQAKLRESLTEAETPDVELDTLPVDEIVQRICRRLGRSPDPALLPWGWDDAGGDKEPPEALDEPADGDVEDAGDPGAGDGPPSRPDRPAGGRPAARPRKPDSS